MRLSKLLLALSFTAFLGCSSDTRDSEQPDTGQVTASESSEGDDSDTETTTSDDGGDGFDLDLPPDGVDDGSNGECTPDTGSLTLTGTVFAPNQEIPVSGALAYFTTEEPEGIPQEVYCDSCVELPCDQHFALTAPDGSFSLSVDPGDGYLVVRKGQFMRVTPYTVGADAVLDVDLTSLPRENHPDQGEYIPSIALGLGVWDQLEDAFAKFGLGDIVLEDGGEKLLPGTEPFDIYDNGGFPEGLTMQGSFEDLIRDYERMKQYHIIFVPCTTDDHVDAMSDPQVVENIRKWVEAGGRWYVTDYANEWMSGPFGQYQTFYEKDPGNADLDLYDSLGTVLDPDLEAWLAALPDGLKDINPLNGGGGWHPTLDALPQVMTLAHYSGVEATPAVWTEDDQGDMVDVGHRTWIEGPGDGDIVPSAPAHPLTVSGQYGCGKILFTSYHTADGLPYRGLRPQELVLMYVILDLGVCQTPTVPPPPVG